MDILIDKAVHALWSLAALLDTVAAVLDGPRVTWAIWQNMRLSDHTSKHMSCIVSFASGEKK